MTRILDHEKTQEYVGSPPSKWASVFAQGQFKYTIEGRTDDGNVHILQSESSFGLDITSLVNTEARIPVYNRMAGDATVADVERARTALIARLSTHSKVRRVYRCVHRGQDVFKVVVPADDLNINTEIAELYWEVYDENPDYDFKIDPVPEGCFDEASLPKGFSEVPVRESRD
jgi:hypothetical protein